MARKQLYINGTPTGDFGIYISSDTYLSAPAIDYTAHQVPGRSGDLLQYNKRLNNIVRKFDCYIPRDVVANFEDFKKLLYSNIGYVTLTSDYDPDTFQRGYLAEELEAVPFQTGENLTAQFTLYFSCQPQKYFKTNTTQSATPHRFPYHKSVGILPRTSQRVRSMLQLLPPEDVPTADAFLIVAGGGSQDVQFSMAGYTGFVGLIEGAVTTGYFEDLPTKAIRAYSTTGTLSTTADTTTGSYPSMLVLPADAAGNAVWTCGSTVYRWTMEPQATFENTDALGVDYKLKFSGEFGNFNSETTTETTAQCYYIRGTLDGVQTISATLWPQHIPFYAYTEGQQTYTAEYTIDSATLETRGQINGHSVNMSDYMGVFGDMDGRADKLEIYAYWAELGHGFTHFWPRTIELQPNWWKV